MDTEYGDPKRKELFKQAESELNAIFSDPGLASVHLAANDYLRFVRTWLYPYVRLDELAESILKPTDATTLRKDLSDFAMLMRRGDAIAEPNCELTEWILNFRNNTFPALDRAILKWRENKSLPWLLSVITKIKPGHPDLPEVLQVSEKISRQSPAYLSNLFHRIRLLTATGKREAARDELDVLLRDENVNMSASTRNLFLGLKLRLSGDLAEFVQAAQWKPARISHFGMDTFDAPHDALAEQTLFNGETAVLINEKIPLRILKQIVTENMLSNNLHRELAKAVWVRSILLEQEDVSREIAPFLAQLIPDIKDHLNAYLSAEDPATRKFTAVYLFLKFPGLRPYVNGGIFRSTPLNEMDSLRDNWWCAFGPDPENFMRNFYPGGTRIPFLSSDIPLTADFLRKDQKSSAVEEWQKLVSLGTAPNYLARAVTEFSLKKPDDPRIPEALHLAVKSSRYGCTDKETGRYSKAAFTRLHQRYAQSSWAKKTKYWFK